MSKESLKVTEQLLQSQFQAKLYQNPEFLVHVVPSQSDLVPHFSFLTFQLPVLVVMVGRWRINS
jgi:hypothetical protein